MPIPIFPAANTIQKASGQAVSSVDYNSTILDQLNRYNLFFAWLATGLESDTVADGGVLSQNVVAKYEDVTSFVAGSGVLSLSLTYSGGGYPFTGVPTITLPTAKTELTTFQLSKFAGDKAKIELYLEALSSYYFALQYNYKSKMTIEVSLYEKTLLSDPLPTIPLKSFNIDYSDGSSGQSSGPNNQQTWLNYSNILTFITPSNSTAKYYFS
jgi:hypothetical protein